MDIATLGLEIDSSEVRGAARDLELLERIARATERTADGVERGFQKVERSASKAGDALSRLRGFIPAITALAAALGVHQLVAYADAWSDMQSRVGAAIKDMEAAPALMQRMVDLANASYSPLSQTVEVYARNVGVLRELGVSAEGAADFTEALNHMLVITATRGERAASVQNALAKAMAVGRLQADGLETVLANGGRVAEALADELGTTVNGLRAMASEGRITSQVIANALLTSLEQVRIEAAEMPATIGDAFTRIQTNTTALIGTLDQAWNISGQVAEQMLEMANAILESADSIIRIVGVLSDNFERLLYWGTAVGAYFGLAWVASMVTAAGVTAALTAAVAALRVALITIGIGAVLVLVGELIYQFMNLVQRTGGVGQAFTLLGQTAQGVWDGIVMAARGIPPGLDAVWHDVQADFLEMIVALEGAWNEFVGRLGGVTWRNPFDPNGQTHTLLGFDALRIDAEAASSAVERLRGRARDLREEAGALANEGFGAAASALERLVNIASGGYMDSPGQGASFSDLQAFLNQGEGNLPATAAAITEVSGSLAAANDNARSLSDLLREDLMNAAKVVEQAWQRLRGWFTGMFADFGRNIGQNASEWKTLGDAIQGVFAAATNAIGGFFTNLGNHLMELASNQIFNMLFGGMMGGGFWQPNGFVQGGFYPGLPNGGLGGGGGIFGGMIIPGILHNGGIAGLDGYGHGRSFPTSLWDTAQRYHNGRIAGLRPDEIPAILQRGERVIPANDVNSNDNRSTVNVKIVNQINVPPGVGPEVGPSIAREVAAAVNKQLPAAIERHQRNPLRRRY